MDKYYTVHVDRYNYFGGASKSETKSFARIIDAFEFWKSSKAHDFDYDDAYQDTHPIREWWDTNPKKTNVHKGKQIAPVEATELAFDDAELEHLMSVATWGDVPFV